MTYVTPKQRPIRSARETETAEHETQLPPLKYPPSTDIEGTHMERRSFHFIQARNLTYTFGKCEIDLWDTNLLQYSRRNPAVEASLLALSSIFEAYEANTMLNDGTALHVHTLHKHAFLQYTKAVSQVLHSLNSKEGDRRPTLLACLMFTWIEIMLGNLDTARRHLQSGVDIIDEIASDPVELVRKDPEDMYGALYRSFLRLRFQTTIGLRPVPQGYSRIGSNDTGDAEVSHFQSKLTQKSTMQEAKSQVWEKPFPDLDWTMQSRIRQIDRLQKADENVSLASNATDELCCRRSLSYKYIELSQAVLTLMTDARKDAKTRLDSIRWSKLLIYVDEIMLGSKPLQYSPITLDFGVFPTLFFILLVCSQILSKLVNSAENDMLTICSGVGTEI